MASDQDNIILLANLFAELKKFEGEEDFEKALKASNKILNVSPHNIKALTCKVVSLIQLGKFEEALNAIDRSELKTISHFEKAYAQYRLNRIDDALSTIAAGSPEDHRLVELHIQILYKIEQYQECYKKYIDLIKNLDDDYEDERSANIAAVIACLSAQQDVKFDFLKDNQNTYEILYNKSCIQIARGSYKNALKNLEKSESICRSFLEDDGASDEEIDSELSVIKAQIAFCYQMLDREDEALKIYNQIFRQKLSDAALMAIISNNILAIHRDQNLFDSKKKVKMALSEVAEQKLSEKQKFMIHFNYCLFLVKTNQVDACRIHLKEHVQQHSDHELYSKLIECFIFVKEKKLDQAIQVLVDYSHSIGNKFNEKSIELLLLLAQLQIKANNYGEACKTLQKVNNVRLYPAILSTLILLYEKTGHTNELEKLYTSAIEKEERNNKTSRLLLILYREVSKFYLAQNKPKVAVEYLNKLVQRKGKSPKLISMLINAYLQFDAAKAQELQRELPSVEDILSSVDTEYLENKNWSLGVKYVKKAKDSGKQVEKKKKKKKKRKTILPKNYDPNTKPDPERWLPKYERSTYRKKKEKKAIGKGTQGAVGEMPEIKVTPKATAASPPGPRQQRPTQKKKKKTGKK